MGRNTSQTSIRSITIRCNSHSCRGKPYTIINNFLYIIDQNIYKLSLHTIQNLKPSLPHIIQTTLDEAIKSPTEILLRRLLVHNNSNTAASGRRSQRPDWILKVLATHTSACSLQDPSLAQDVHNALIHIHEKESCGKLLQAAMKDAALVTSPSPSAVQKLAMAAPVWLPSPAAIASEYLAYFNNESTLELAAGAMLLRQQQELLVKTNNKQIETAAEVIETPDPAVRAELLAMALCLPRNHHREQQPSSILDSPRDTGDQAELPVIEKEKERANRKKLSRRLPENPLAHELYSLLHSTPTLAVTLPPPLLSHACRSSFLLSLEYAAALKKLREDQNTNVPVTAVISALKHACLINDTTALLFKDALDNVYRSI